MAKSISAVVSLVAKDVALDVVAGNYRFTLSGTAGDVTQESADPTVTFADVAAGDYTVSVVRLDANTGVELEAAVSASITVPADTQSVDVPASVTVSLV